jgi:hypothetical protein
MRLTIPELCFCLLAAAWASSIAYGQEQVISVVKAMESEASAETQSLVRDWFIRARSIEFRFIPYRMIEPRGYSAKDAWYRYGYVYHCDTACEAQAARLEQRLSSAMRASGKCPRITGAVVFRGANDVELSRIEVAPDGRCLVMGGQTYLLSEERSLKYLIEAHEKIF